MTNLQHDDDIGNVPVQVFFVGLLQKREARQHIAQQLDGLAVGVRTAAHQRGVSVQGRLHDEGGHVGHVAALGGAVR